MAADYSPLDTRSRQKTFDILSQLGDFGLSEDDILRAYREAEGLGRQNLKNYYDTAGLSIGRSFEPRFQQATNYLGANPLLADSGYSNRLQRQIMTDLGARLADDYGAHAAEQATSNLDYLKGLRRQRATNRAGLAQGAYQTFTGLPRKPSVGSQIGQGVSTAAGAALGAYSGRR